MSGDSFKADPPRTESWAAVMRDRPTRKDAVIYALLVLLIGGTFNAGYWCGAHADKPNGLAASIAVTVFVALAFFIQGLWRAAGDTP